MARYQVQLDPAGVLTVDAARFDVLAGHLMFWNQEKDPVASVAPGRWAHVLADDERIASNTTTETRIQARAS